MITPPFSSPLPYYFGDNPGMTDELVNLILSGKKTATCGPLRDYELEGNPLPSIGLRANVIGADGKPKCLIEITEVRVRAFNTMDADFALAEGEGDGSLKYWKESHRKYFEKNGGWSPDMDLVCERFRILETY